MNETHITRVLSGTDVSLAFDFAQKLKKVIFYELVDGIDSVENRTQLAAREAEKVKSLLKVPQVLGGVLRSGIDVVAKSREVIDKFMGHLLDILMEQDKDGKKPEVFIEEAKDSLTYFFGEWINSIQYAFERGDKDLQTFFTFNFKQLLIAS